MSGRRALRLSGFVLMVAIGGLTAGFFLYPIERLGKRGAALYWLALLGGILLLMLVALADLGLTYCERRRLMEELQRRQGGNK